MAHRAVTVHLVSDGQCTPWGFRMSGGADIGTPLVIQRVNMGSPAEGELQKGDIILCIGDHDARKLSHQKASEVIAKAGNNLQLVVARTSGAPPMSPTPGMPVTMYHLNTNPMASSPMTSSMPPLVSGHGYPDLFKPLPKTEFHETIRTTSKYDNMYNEYTADEKAVITNQAYRTLPLITPSLKTTKDYPLGSYLRHNADTSGRSAIRPTANVGNRVTDAYMLTKVQEAVLEKALSSPRASASSSRTPTPDSGYQSVYHRQYNSPINIYSTQTLVETLNAQTSAVQKHVLEPPRVQTPTTLAPADLSKSPTYQLIQQQEWEELQKKNLREHDAVENRLYDIEEPPKSGFGSYEDIQQSSSFKALLTGKGITNV